MKPRILISHPISTTRLQSLPSSLEFDCITEKTDKYQQVEKVIAKYDGLFSLQVQVDDSLLSKAQNLKVVAYDKENKLLLVKGAVPGAKNWVVKITKSRKKAAAQAAK